MNDLALALIVALAVLAWIVGRLCELRAAALREEHRRLMREVRRHG